MTQNNTLMFQELTGLYEPSAVQQLADGRFLVVEDEKQYLIISGPASREPVHFNLWFWSGQPDASAQRVTVPGLLGFERAEGVSPALVDGKQQIIIVSDDGSRKDQRYARFLLLEPAQLQIAS